MRKPTPAKQAFLYVAPFPALVFFKIWAGLGQTGQTLFPVACAMLVYCVLVLFVTHRWDRPSYFDWAVTFYFLIGTLALFFWPRGTASLFASYAVTGIYVCLFGASFFPPLLRMDPFTYHYAKKYTPQEVWGNPVFKKINFIMTYVWSAIFALSLLLSLYPSVITRAFIPLTLILGIGLPFNVRFPAFYLKRLGLPSLAEQRKMAQGKIARPKQGVSSDSPPKTAWEAIAAMPNLFNAEAAGDLVAMICFIVSGSESFEVCLNIQNGTCTIKERPSRKPDLVIHTPADVWLAIARGEMDGQQGFTQKAYRAEGNLGILIRMKQLFTETFSTGRESGKYARLSEHSKTDTKETLNLPNSRKEKTMKVLALNSSPRTGSVSKTEIMLNRLVQGMREAGAEVEVVELRKKNIKNCIGCFTCWTKTPGVCIHKDDMTSELYPKWTASDLVVYATPLYHFTLNALMKKFIERTLPLLQPFFAMHEGRTYHPLRGEHPKMVFLSVAGFPELTVFDQLSSWVNSVYGRDGLVVAQIYRPMAEAMLAPPLEKKAKEILDATIQGGREIVESMKIFPETMKRITQPLLEENRLFFQIGNLMWKTCIAEGLTPREMEEKGIVPRPDSLETFMIIMPMGFNAKAAGDTRAVMQFQFRGEVEGTCHFKIENGDIQVFHGPADKPDLTIESPFSI